MDSTENPVLEAPTPPAEGDDPARLRQDDPARLRQDDPARLRHDALRAEVKRIAEAKGRPMSEIAKEIGIVYGTFSQWVTGIYRGRVEKYDDIVQRWLDTRSCAARQRAAMPEGPGFVLTPGAQAIMAVLEHAQHASDLAMVTGAAGVGKTSAIGAYRNRSTNVWVVTGEPCLATPRMMLDEIAEQVGVNEGRTSHRVSRAIVQRLRGTHGLLVIDEAQHLSTGTLDQVRTLHDMSGVGVALVGNERVSSRIEGGTRSPEFAQLFSRIGMRHTRPRPTKGDVEALLNAWEVADGEARSLLATIARKPGALRSCIKVLRIASMQATAAGEALTGRFVQMAYQGLAATPLDTRSEPGQAGAGR